MGRGGRGPLTVSRPNSLCAWLQVFTPELLTPEEMTYFHTDEYVEFLRLITPDNQARTARAAPGPSRPGAPAPALTPLLPQHEHMRQLKRFNVGEDCPVFDGLFQFCQTYSGGSVGGAVRLNRGETDAAINWMGGLHHAKARALDAYGRTHARLCALH